LSNTIIFFSTDNFTPKILTWDTHARIDAFTTILRGVTSVVSLYTNYPIEVTFNTAQIPAKAKITIELKPEFDASCSYKNYLSNDFSKEGSLLIFLFNIPILVLSCGNRTALIPCLISECDRRDIAECFSFRKAGIPDYSLPFNRA
jgi:hypothetical protein